MYSGVPTAVRWLPERLGLIWSALMEDPNAALFGGQLSQAPIVATDPILKDIETVVERKVDSFF